MSSSLSAKKPHTLPGGELPDSGDHWGNRMWEINADSTSKCKIRWSLRGFHMGYWAEQGENTKCEELTPWYNQAWPVFPTVVCSTWQKLAGQQKEELLGWHSLVGSLLSQWVSPSSQSVVIVTSSLSAAFAEQQGSARAPEWIDVSAYLSRRAAGVTHWIQPDWWVWPNIPALQM